MDFDGFLTKNDSIFPNIYQFHPKDLTYKNISSIFSNMLHNNFLSKTKHT